MSAGPWSRALEVSLVAFECVSSLAEELADDGGASLVVSEAFRMIERVGLTGVTVEASLSKSDASASVVLDLVTSRGMLAWW